MLRLSDAKRRKFSKSRIRTARSCASSVTFKSSKFRCPCKSGDGDDSTVEKSSNLHKRLLTTFQGFVHQLDELFLSLKAEECLTSNGYIPEFTSYQDICEKLRLEVLIAIDKLEMSSFAGVEYNETNMDFLNKMNNLKYQLTDITCQYHNAIKDFDFRHKHDEIDD